MTADRSHFFARSGVIRTALPALLVLFGCYAGARAGIALRYPDVGAAVLFPPYAVLAAALMLSPVRRWWVFVLASAAGNFWPHLRHEGLPSFVVLAEVANIVRALVAAWGVRWLGGRAGYFDTLRDTIAFLLFAVGIGPIIGALIGTLAVMRHDPASDFRTTWQAWLLSNMLTGLTLLPLILIVCTRTRGRIWRVPAARIVEAVVLSILIVAVGAYIFVGSRGGSLHAASLYAPLPLLLWAAVRFGPGGMIAALSAIAGLTIAGALSGRGPFVSHAPAENLIQLQYFLIALCIPLLLLAALVRQQTQTAMALVRSQAEYRAVVEDQTEMICRFLPDGASTFVNGAFCRSFNSSAEMLLGRTFWEIVAPETRDAVRGQLASITANHPVAMTEHEVLGPDGQKRWQQWTQHGLFDEQGQIVAYQAVGRDITERRRSEIEAQELRQGLAHAGRVTMLGQLASSLAHELSQPLGAILRNAEAAELLLQGASPDLDELRAIVADIHKDDHRAGDVIDRLRSLLKRRSLESHALGMDNLVDEVVVLVRSDAAARRVKLATNVPPDLPLVRGDRVHLLQVLLNLTINGMDAVDAELDQQRCVTLGARSDGNGMIEVAVSDCGHGVPPEKLGNLFDPFFTTKPQGMGMGLPISKTIVEAHGGRIWAENNADRGTTFRFTLSAAGAGEGDTA